MKLKYLNHKARLTKACKDDIKWWLMYIDTWNQKTMFYDEFWSNSTDMNFFTDSSGKSYGAICGNQWLFGSFSTTQAKLSIEWKELCAIVISCCTWGHLFVSKKILIHTDNSAIVYSVNKGSSRNKDIMFLIRTLHFIAVKHNFECRLTHIEGTKNVAADLLSRGKIDLFLQKFPSFKRPSTKAVTPW